MNLKNGEREPSDEEDGIPERQYDFNLVVMDADESDANEENLIFESSTSDSETVYSHSLSGVPPPSPALARQSSSNLTVEEEAEPDSIAESSSPSQSQPSLDSASRTQPSSGDSTAAENHVDRDQSPSNYAMSAFGLEIVHEVIEEVLMSFIIHNSDSDSNVENQEADDDYNGRPSILASNIQIHLEDLVPLESCLSSQSSEADVAGSGVGENLDDEHSATENPSLVRFPSTASTLVLSQSPETIPAGSGLSSGLVLSPDKEPPVPIARSSPVIHTLEERSSPVIDNLKDRATLSTQGDHENNPSSTEDGLDLDEEEFESESDSGDEADCFMGVMKGIEQLEPKSNEKEKEALLNVSIDMFASQSQESQPTHESHPIEGVEVEHSTLALKYFVEEQARKPQCNDGRADHPDPSQELPSTSHVRQVAVIVPNDNQATPGIATQDPAATAEDPPAVGAKRPREGVDELGGNLQAQEPDKARRKLDFRAKKKKMSKSKRAGLVFSVSKINNRIKEGKYAKRSGVTAGVYLAGVLEYLVAEVAELAGRVAV